MAYFSGVTFVLLCFIFVFMLSLKPRLFVQSFFDMQAHRWPHVFVYLELYGEYFVRFTLPNGVFLPCNHGLDF